MVAGGDTFINTIISKAGLVNVFSNKSRYPIISFADLQEQSPEVVLLSSEQMGKKKSPASGEGGTNHLSEGLIQLVFRIGFKFYQG